MADTVEELAHLRHVAACRALVVSPSATGCDPRYAWAYRLLTAGLEQAYERRRAAVRSSDLYAPADLEALMAGNRNYGRRDEQPLGEEVERDFRQAGGWHIEHAGATGTPRGRPVTGVTNADALSAELRRLARVSDIRELRKAFGKGADAALRDRLALAVHELRNGARPANAASLALLLGCGKRTVYGLAEEGRLLAQKPPTIEGATPFPMPDDAADAA